MKIHLEPNRDPAVGGVALARRADLAKSARFSADAVTGVSAGHLLSELLALHEHLIVQLRADSETCSARYQDSGIADFLTGLRAEHEKTAWTLRAQLSSRERKTA